MSVEIKGAVVGVKTMLTAGALILAMLIGVASAAAANGPEWSLETEAPTYMRPGKGAVLEVFATNDGSGSTSVITLTDRLPSGLELAKLADLEKLPGIRPGTLKFRPLEIHWTGTLDKSKRNYVPETIQNIDLANPTPELAEVGGCAGSTPQELKCSVNVEILRQLYAQYFPGWTGEIEPGETLAFLVSVAVSPSAPEGPIASEATTDGGGAAPASARLESKVSARPRFEIVGSSLQTTEPVQVPEDLRHWGYMNRPAPFTQAGGHPDALTTTVDWATEDYLSDSGFEPTPTGNPKDVTVFLPPGLLGNPTAVPQCPLKVALSFSEHCPAATQIGIVAAYMAEGNGKVGPIYNVTPEAGQSAEFLLTNETKVNFLLTAHVVREVNPTTKQEEYGLAVVSKGDPSVELRKVETTFWGEPASKAHDAQRGLFCTKAIAQGSWNCERKNEVTGIFGLSGNEVSGEPEVPFLTWPSDCAAGNERASVESDSWEEPVRFEGSRIVSGEYVRSEASIPGATDCGLLQFSPGIEITADTLQADSPVGLGVALSVPQFEEPQRLATPEIRKSVISLPSGLSVNPGIVDGVQACNEFGPEGINIDASPGGANESEEVNKLNGEVQLATGHCPDASIVGTVEAETPLLRVPIKGHVYLARPACGNAALGQAPCTERDVLDGDLYQLYLELGGTGALADTGVNIKVRLKTKVDPATGQLTSVGEEIAQLPFSKLVVKLNGGPRAPLANPPACGPAVTTADFTPWAAPGTTPEGVFMQGLGDVTPSSFFNVDEGCASPPPLKPGFVAGTVTANAGKFSPFTVNISRKDREQYIRGVQVHTPPGLIGVLANVPLCGEAEANAGTCSEASKIGTTRVASGAGSHPFEIEGNVYLTGPHDGAPFGLSVVTNVVAGPFDLGKVVVRARIDIDRHDSSLMVTTDETGPYALPQIVFGVPLRLQRITVNIDRERFMLNPTNCGAQQITAKISGSQQAAASVSSGFAVGGCRSLAFKPVFKASTNGHTSRKLGASLDTRLSYPKGALGNDANVAGVKVSLPRQLPSFLATLQEACVDTTFESNPAACPKGSIVGIARTSTPTLPVTLEGPVYFVSHGGAKFPDLVIVLEGDHIRVDLVGSTFISKGITSSTFKTVPDVPVESFELYLPQGGNHALAANGKLCNKRGKLVMPTEFVAQNGMVVRQKTKIAVTGCARSKPKKAHGHSKRGPGASANASGSKGRR